MKKTAFFALVCAIVILCSMVFDYLYNERIHRVQLYTVSLTDLREETGFTAPIYREGNWYLMEGAIPLQDNLAVGAEAVVTLGDERLEGYLYRLEPALDGIGYATVSVLSDHPIAGEATATIYGVYRQGLIYVPPECITVDAHGKDAVYVDVMGYAVCRPVEVGEQDAHRGRRILSGVFQKERLILSPKNIRTGDRISS